MAAALMTLGFSNATLRRSTSYSLGRRSWMRRASTVQSRPPENNIATRGEMSVASGGIGTRRTRRESDCSSFCASSLTAGESSCSGRGAMVKLSLFIFGNGDLWILVNIKIEQRRKRIELEKGLILEPSPLLTTVYAPGHIPRSYCGIGLL